MKAYGTLDIVLNPENTKLYMTSKHNPLTAEDRCDYCGAQAWAQVEMRDSDLLFCKHHFDQYKASLVEQSHWIRDYTQALSN